MPFTSRIKPPSRPLRPPLTKFYRATRVHRFALKPRLNILASATTRPQLSFLTSARHAPVSGRTTFFSTETKNFIKHQSKLATKYTFVGLVITTAGLSWMWMLTQEMVDRDFPAPPEWSFLTKVVYHAARGLEVPGANESGVVNWNVCGLAYRDLLRRLEDTGGDGRGLLEQEVEGAGFDLENMSPEWRRGYYAALMGCGRAAIELEDAVLDTTQNFRFKRVHMVGPSNPRPKPLPKRIREKRNLTSPLEENCVPVYAPPETYYLKIMTTKGFTAREKMDAALAYGAWCDFKGMHDTAEEMFSWALDCAAEGLPPSITKIDKVTGVLPNSIPITDNLLDATTALAIHRAQSGNPISALPIFLSLLRARRQAPPAAPSDTLTSPPAKQSRDTKLKRTDLDVLQDQMSAFWSLLQASKFPDPPPSGNDPFVRTPDNDAEEAALMTYVGEILFASQRDQQGAGLRWTTGAVEKAWATCSSSITSREAKVKAVETLRVATENRMKMVKLRLSEAESRLEQVKNAPTWMKWVPGLMWGQAGLEQEKEEWEREREKAVEFDTMLYRGRVYDVSEGMKPVWGTLFLKEWVLPRLAGAKTFER